MKKKFVHVLVIYLTLQYLQVITPEIVNCPCPLQPLGLTGGGLVVCTCAVRNSNFGRARIEERVQVRGRVLVRSGQLPGQHEPHHRLAPGAPWTCASACHPHRPTAPNCPHDPNTGRRAAQLGGTADLFDQHSSLLLQPASRNPVLLN